MVVDAGLKGAKHMNASTLTIGRSGFGAGDLLGRVAAAFEILRAASRVAASVENRRAPRAEDLVTLGIDDVPGVTELILRR
jgi:hypothetical protein